MGTLDPRKLIELKINHSHENFQITVYTLCTLKLFELNFVLCFSTSKCPPPLNVGWIHIFDGRVIMCTQTIRWLIIRRFMTNIHMVDYRYITCTQQQHDVVN